VLIEALMDEGFSVQLKHDSTEAHSKIGDVMLTTKEGGVLSQCPAFQHNSNYMKREDLAAKLVGEAAKNFESGATTDHSTGEMAAAAEDSDCCGKKAQTGTCCGAKKKEKADAATGSCCSSGGCSYSTSQMVMIGVGLGLALALTFYFSSPAAPAAPAAILPDGMDGMAGETVEA